MRLGTSFLLCLRTKLRGNPKALGFAAPHHRMKWWCEGITKDKTETSYLASLMIGGIVISLEILVIEMGYRGSKSVIQRNDYCKRATSRRFFSYFYLLWKIFLSLKKKAHNLFNNTEVINKDGNSHKSIGVFIISNALLFLYSISRPL